MVNELKSCPFCGGPGKLIHTMGLWAEGKYGPHGSKIVCDYDNTCKAHVASYGDNQTEEAITAWNTRADTARLSELEAEVARLRESSAALEALRPHWAQGYSSDSMAAQVATTALSGLWQMLDAKHQTDAVQKLRLLLARAALEAGR